MFELIVGALVWVLALESIDNFIAQKIPKKYEGFILPLMYYTFWYIFVIILVIIGKILILLQNDKKH